MLFENEKEDSIIKVTDFGLSKIIDSEVLITPACGTPGYVGNVYINFFEIKRKSDLI